MQLHLHCMACVLRYADFSGLSRLASYCLQGTAAFLLLSSGPQKDERTLLMSNEYYAQQD